jgi:hypothetical protein
LLIKLAELSDYNNLDMLHNSDLRMYSLNLNFFNSFFPPIPLPDDHSQAVALNPAQADLVSLLN